MSAKEKQKRINFHLLSIKVEPGKSKLTQLITGRGRQFWGLKLVTGDFGDL